MCLDIRRLEHVQMSTHSKHV